MLPNLETKTLHFPRTQEALNYLNSYSQQRHLLQPNHLHIDANGMLNYYSSPTDEAIAQLQELSLTDTALSQLNALTGVSSKFARKIDSTLHAHILNEQLKYQLTPVTVIVEHKIENPDQRWVTAVLSNGQFGLSHALVLEWVDTRELPASIQLDSGRMEVHFGDPYAVEVLPNDKFHLKGFIDNYKWGINRASSRPVLASGLYLLRLVCSNGAYARRNLANNRLMTGATKKELYAFLDRQLQKTFQFSQTLLADAIATMSETIPEEAQREPILKSITRAVGQEKAEILLQDAVSWYDHWNALTASAHDVETPERRRKIQLEGGKLLEQFFLK
jgi:hypothetical protein